MKMEHWYVVFMWIVKRKWYELSVDGYAKEQTPTYENARVRTKEIAAEEFEAMEDIDVMHLDDK